MNIVQPIRDIAIVNAIKNNLLNAGKMRDWFMFELGVNSGLRIGDMLPLDVSYLRNQSHLRVRTEKTGKEVMLKINDQLAYSIQKYTKYMGDNDLLFPSRKGDKPIRREQAYRIISQAAKDVGHDGEVGCHTTRKTFAYHLYKQTKDVALVQRFLGHTSPSVTLRYIGIDQDVMDEAIIKFKL